MLRCGVVAMLVLAGTAAAQGVTGAIQGTVVDATTGEPLAGVEVTIGSRHARTDDRGTYRITDILPGRYEVVFEDGDARDDRAMIVVAAGATTEVDGRILFHHDDLLRFHTAAPDIDPHATAPAYLLDHRELTDVPQPGLTFDDALGGVPGSQGDGTGVAFWGSSSLENRYVLDGADLTELQYGGVGSIVPLEFLDQIRVTGGGSTGALVQAVTKHGTNDWHGGVFGSDAPSWLQATPRSGPATQTIDVRFQAAEALELGGELAGPLVKDHLWFYAAVAPMRWGVDYLRTIRRQIDRDQNGIPDLDPRTGLPATEAVASEVRSAPASAYPLLARLDAAITPDQQGTLTVLAVPQSGDSPGMYGLASTGTHSDELTADLAASWRSRLLDGRLELDATLGWHHEGLEIGAIDPSVAGQPLKSLIGPGFGQIASLGGESPAAVAGCTDDPHLRSTIDPYPLITNCPISSYATGGPGTITRDTQNRYTAAVSATARVRAAGLHELQVGLDVRADALDHAQIFSGGEFDLVASGDTIVDQMVALAPAGTTDPRYDHRCPVGMATVLPCEILTSLDEASRRYGATDAAVYARDSWQVLPNLAVAGGVRVENQRVAYGNNVRGGVDPVTGMAVPDDLLHLTGALAPDIGATYDPTGTGRAKLFAHWGRSFEAIPLDLAIPASGGQPELVSTSLCPSTQPGCVAVAQLADSGVIRALPGLQPEYVDEAVAGGQLELDGIVLGAALRDRRLGNVIEDVSLDGLATYVLANPGEGAARGLDHPERVYDALELTAARRFGPLYVLASYTYSRTYGDYPGSISYDDGLIQPHTTPEYDLPELDVNRRGPLPLDRPHYFKLDAAYTWRLGADTQLVVGSRLRALSGAPEEALGPHWLYSPNEVHLLPASAFGHAPFVHQLDLHLACRRTLPHATTAELYVDLFNVEDQREAFTLDEDYAGVIGTQGYLQSAAAISGGSYSDLIWAKAIDAEGKETRLPLARNPDFHQPVAFYNPMYARIGFRLVF